jgi:hypothetical protein
VDERALRVPSHCLPSAWLALSWQASSIMAFLYVPRPGAFGAVFASQPVPGWPQPSRAWALTQGEQKWLADSGVETAERWRFEWRGLKGSLLMVTSDTWRAHHRPERCFEVYGLTVESAHTALVQPDFPVRLLSLGVGRRGAFYPPLIGCSPQSRPPTITPPASGPTWTPSARIGCW